MRDGHHGGQARKDGWLDEASCERTFDRVGVVSVRERLDGCGAYPDTGWRGLVVDTRTGAELGVEPFTPAGRAALARLVDAAMQKEKPTADPEVADLIADAHFDPSV